MNAFGKRGGMGGGGRPQFGVAKPMKSAGGGSAAPAEPEGGEQFPPVPDLTDNIENNGQDPQGVKTAAMDRLTARQNGDGGQANGRNRA